MTDKEQLMNIRHCLFAISGICVDESKQHFSSDIAVDKIREQLRKLDWDYIINLRDKNDCSRAD